jgi:hypothetical protein
MPSGTVYDSRARPVSRKIWYHLIHTVSGKDRGMATADLYALVEEFASRINQFDLSADGQEEYSAVLCRLENQVDRPAPTEQLSRNASRSSTTSSLPSQEVLHSSRTPAGRSSRT